MIIIYCPIHALLLTAYTFYNRMVQAPKSDLNMRVIEVNNDLAQQRFIALWFSGLTRHYDVFRDISKRNPKLAQDFLAPNYYFLLLDARFNV
uniref:Uncharacterized protein n=1 Tax=Elaeophora elaphi TaxID=1147741 RepID=A0A0R3S1M4_9BILA